MLILTPAAAPELSKYPMELSILNNKLWAQPGLWVPLNAKVTIDRLLTDRTSVAFSNV